MSDGMGSYTETWATATTLACRRVSSLRQAEQRIAERLAVPAMDRPSGCVERRTWETDRLVIGGDTLEVIHVAA